MKGMLGNWRNIVDFFEEGTISVTMYSPPFHARLIRRVQALIIDWAIIGLLVVLYMIAIQVWESDVVKKMGFFIVIGCILLYEPILISTMGGTIGHRWKNLRVLAVPNKENLGFFRAFARMLVKGIFGWASFVFMALTNRHQAFHDLVGMSTVEIYDPSRATSADYVLERQATSLSLPVSVSRRIFVILVYGLLVCIGIGNTANVFVSHLCLEGGYCTKADTGILSLLGMVFLILCCCVVVLGWRGKLFGARVCIDSS